MSSRLVLCTTAVAVMLVGSLALGAKPKKPCVTVNAHARASYPGYDHIVTIINGCKKRVTCSVATNVNPDAVSVSVDPGEKKSVLTFRGSPAREFEPRVSCKGG